MPEEFHAQRSLEGIIHGVAQIKAPTRVTKEGLRRRLFSYDLGDGSCLSYEELEEEGFGRRKSQYKCLPVKSARHC